MFDEGVPDIECAAHRGELGGRAQHLHPVGIGFVLAAGDGVLDPVLALGQAAAAQPERVQRRRHPHSDDGLARLARTVFERRAHVRLFAVQAVRPSGLSGAEPFAIGVGHESGEPVPVSSAQRRQFAHRREALPPVLRNGLEHAVPHRPIGDLADHDGLVD
ncbi:hypothetical protein P9209_09780 [Prescottella defluvii]|nr:hypothetical protein P9209_09780 [Prescottella defluvii]